MASGLSIVLGARTLVVRGAPGFRDPGFSSAFGFAPYPSSERGLSLSLTNGYGAASSGGAEVLMLRHTLQGLTANCGSVSGTDENGAPAGESMRRRLCSISRRLPISALPAS